MREGELSEKERGTAAEEEEEEWAGEKLGR